MQKWTELTVDEQQQQKGQISERAVGAFDSYIIEASSAVQRNTESVEAEEETATAVVVKDSTRK